MPEPISSYRHTYTGRRKILTDLLPPEMQDGNYGAVTLNEESLKKDLVEAMQIHSRNASECEYLVDYFRGRQPILTRSDENKVVNNRIVLNFANAISRNISAYTYSNGIQYVSSNPKFFEDVKKINDYMRLENKATLTEEMRNYQSICGTAYLGAFPDKVARNAVPFEIVSMSPINTFVVYSVFNPNVPVYGCALIYLKENGKNYVTLQVYTHNEIYVFKAACGVALNIRERLHHGTHPLGAVPIIEYPNNAFRLGDFETVLTLLDSMNVLSSDCVNNIETIVTSYLALFGIELEDGDMDRIKKDRVLVFKGAPGIQQDAKFIFSQLDGQSTELLRSYLESALKFITGIPDRDTGSAGSDTGLGAEIRTGTNDLEVVAKVKALYAEQAERQLLRIVLEILSPKYISRELSVSDISIDITRVNRDNILTKTQSGINMQQLGFTEEDVVFNMAITNDVSGLAERTRKNKEKMQAATDKSTNTSNTANTATGKTSTEVIEVEEAVAK